MHYIVLFMFFILVGCNSDETQMPITVYSAASTNHLIKELSEVYHQKTGQKVVGVFASSSTLTRQIEQGANADIFLSANMKWMDELQKKVEVKSRKNLLKNALVLVSSKNNNIKVSMDKTIQLSSVFKGLLAMGDPLHVPAGMYAKEALSYMNWWSSISTRVVRAVDVRSALYFVESGECELGVVYESDALMSKKVNIVGNFPHYSHSSIVYPVALLSSEQRVKNFYNFLFSPAARQIYQQYAFHFYPSNSTE